MCSSCSGDYENPGFTNPELEDDGVNWGFGFHIYASIRAAIEEAPAHESYTLYAECRTQFPRVRPQQWEMLFGSPTASMELRFYLETAQTACDWMRQEGVLPS